MSIQLCGSNRKMLLEQEKQSGDMISGIDKNYFIQSGILEFIQNDSLHPHLFNIDFFTIQKHMTIFHNSKYF